MMSFQNSKLYLLSTEEPHVGIGGKNTHLLLLERGFHNIGVNFSTIYPDPSFYNDNLITTQIMRALRYKNLQIIFSPIFRHIYGLYDSLIPQLNKISVDNSIIFHCHDVLTLSMVNHCFPNLDCTKILTVHGYYTQEIIDDSLLDKKSAHEKYYDFCINVEKKAVDSADHIIAVDSRIKDYISAQFLYDKEKISVFQNATDTDLFHPLNDEQITQLRIKYNINPNDFIIFVPRRLVPKNGVEYAIKAIKEISVDNVKMFIAGDGILRKDLEKLAEGDDRIYFMGDIPHDLIIDYYQLSDIVVVPSITSNNIQEATSLSMLEGMACGKVVICSDIGGMREVLTKSSAGILVPEKSSKGITDALKKVIDDDSGFFSEMGSIAREYVIKNHSYITYAENLVTLYTQIRLLK